MVARTIFVIDNEALVVDSSSNAAIVGNGVINSSDTPDGTIFNFSSGSGAFVTIEDDGAFADTIPADNNLFFNDDELNDHQITDGGGLVANGTQVEAESRIEIQALDAIGNPTGNVITITVFSQNGVTQNIWGFGFSEPLVNGTQYIKVGGDTTGTTEYADFATCFGPETQILTENGTRSIKDIAIGQRVWTLYSGYQSVRWIGHTSVAAQGNLAPVVFAPGSIGNEQELVVSQEHRIHLKSAMAELLFGSDECLVAAKHLCTLPGVALREGGEIEYFHLMFDRHEIIRGNGVLSESFFLSEHSISAVEQSQRAELLSLFPNLAAGLQAQGSTATLTLKAHEAVLLMASVTSQNSGFTSTAA